VLERYQKTYPPLSNCMLHINIEDYLVHQCHLMFLELYDQLYCLAAHIVGKYADPW
jgi:hypothetical protein